MSDSASRSDVTRLIVHEVDGQKKDGKKKKRQTRKMSVVVGGTIYVTATVAASFDCQMGGLFSASSLGHSTTLPSRSTIEAILVGV